MDPKTNLLILLFPLLIGWFVPGSSVQATSNATIVTNNKQVSGKNNGLGFLELTHAKINWTVESNWAIKFFLQASFDRKNGSDWVFSAEKKEDQNVLQKPEESMKYLKEQGLEKLFSPELRSSAKTKYINSDSALDEEDRLRRNRYKPDDFHYLFYWDEQSNSEKPKNEVEDLNVITATENSKQDLLELFQTEQKRNGKDLIENYKNPEVIISNVDKRNESDSRSPIRGERIFDDVDKIDYSKTKDQKENDFDDSVLDSMPNQMWEEETSNENIPEEISMYETDIKKDNSDYYYDDEILSLAPRSLDIVGSDPKIAEITSLSWYYATTKPFAKETGETEVSGTSEVSSFKTHKETMEDTSSALVTESRFLTTQETEIPSTTFLAETSKNLMTSMLVTRPDQATNTAYITTEEKVQKSSNADTITTSVTKKLNGNTDDITAKGDTFSTSEDRLLLRFSKAVTSITTTDSDLYKETPSEAYETDSDLHKETPSEAYETDTEISITHLDDDEVISLADVTNERISNTETPFIFQEKTTNSIPYDNSVNTTTSASEINSETTIESLTSQANDHPIDANAHHSRMSETKIIGIIIVAVSSFLILITIFATYYIRRRKKKLQSYVSEVDNPVYNSLYGAAKHPSMGINMDNTLFDLESSDNYSFDQHEAIHAFTREGMIAYYSTSKKPFGQVIVH